MRVIVRGDYDGRSRGELMSTESRYWIEMARARTEQFWRDLEAEFGMLTAPQVADALGVGRDVPSQLRQRGELIAVDRSGEARYPAFQIAEGRPRPIIARLTEVRLQHSVPEVDLIFWLCAPWTSFRDHRRPVDHFDDPDLVVAAADAHWGVVF